MKHLWKHLMCTALCLCLLFSAALAEAVDINLHVMTDYTDADAWTVRSGQVVGANLYLLVSNLYGGSNDGQVRLERWSAGMNEPETVLEGLRIRGWLTLPYPLWPIERGVASAYEVKSCCFS